MIGRLGRIQRCRNLLVPFGVKFQEGSIARHDAKPQKVQEFQASWVRERGPSIDWGVMNRAIRPVGYVAGWGLLDGMDTTFG